jgi:hypothetical protein
VAEAVQIQTWGWNSSFIQEKGEKDYREIVLYVGKTIRAVRNFNI